MREVDEVRCRYNRVAVGRLPRWNQLVGAAIGLRDRRESSRANDSCNCQELRMIPGSSPCDLTYGGP